MRRFGQMIKLHPEKAEYYKNLHAKPWPGVKEMIKACHIQYFSIYVKDGYLFKYLEYTGDDYEGDIKKMETHLLTQNWWSETDPWEPFETRKSGESWADMEEVYHLD
jgi:L-rhamnose mutarotase